MNGKMKATSLAIVIEGVEIYGGWQQDGQTFGYNTQKQIVGATYGLAGAIIGAKIGAAFGAFFFGVGSIPAAVIGGYLGGMYSEDGVEYLYDKLNE